MQNGQFESKTKIVKNVRKIFLEPHYGCSIQKAVPKQTYYLRNDKFSKLGKIGHHAKAVALAKWSLWAKKLKTKKHTKNKSKATLEWFYAKNGSKKTHYLRNDKFSKLGKIGHHAKAVALAKWSLWAKKLKTKKHTKNKSKATLEWFYAKNGSKKTHYLRNDKFSKLGKSGHHGRASVFAKWSLWVKKLKTKKHTKNKSKATLEWFYAKNGSKKTHYLRNDKFSKLGKSGHHGRASVFAKWSLWVKKLKTKKHTKNKSKATLEWFYAKNGSKKTHYLRNDKFSKLGKSGHHRWASVFAKWSLWA